VAGASGVIGLRLVRLLVASGHAVTGTTRSPERAAGDPAARAVARGEPGVYNIVDDGGAVSNTKARAALGWDPSLR
jgi:nucleoside-diphosphate-sugar epimerase